MNRVPKVPQVANTIAKVLLGAAGVGYLGVNSLFNVEAGQKAVMFSRLSGVGNKVYGEGTHLRVPWLERPQMFDIRTRPKKVQSPTGTKDLQTVSITLRVLYKPIADKLPSIWANLGVDYDDRVLPSLVNETLKSTIAKYDAAQLITRREEVSRRIRDDLVRRSHLFQIDVEDVSIVNLDFTKEFSNAVELKQVAQQNAERAKFLVMKAVQDKKSAIIKAQGEAKAAELIGQAIKKDPGFIEIRRLEAAREIATTVSRSNNKIYLNSDSLLLNLLDTTTNDIEAGSKK